MSSAAYTNASPRPMADELTYELLRDEWELLLAVGTGPTSAEVAAARTGADVGDVTRRLGRLARYGLLELEAGGYRLVPAIHERREGMSSFLRDLVIHRLALGGERPVACGYRSDLGDAAALARLIADADASLLPAVFEAASPPAGPASRRYALFFAAAAGAPPVPAADVAEDPTGALVAVLRHAAMERARPEARDSAKLWVGDMLTDPAIADRIAAMFDTFLTTAPAAAGTGAAVFALLASDPRSAEARGKHLC